MKLFLRNSWPWLAAIFSGIMLTFSFAPYEQDWLVWLALIPLLCAAWFGKLSGSKRFLVGWLGGVFFFGMTFFWLGKVTAAGWFGLTVYLAIYPAIWTWLAGLPACRIPLSKLVPGQSPWRRSITSLAVAITLASAWALLEWLRGCLFGGMTWNGLGVALHTNIPFLQLASVGGVPFLSWLIVFSNVIVVTTISRLIAEAGRLTFASRSDFTFGLALVLGSFGYGVSLSFDHTNDREIKVSLVQAATAKDPLREYMHLSTLALLQNPDLIVWPESAPGAPLLDSLPVLKKLAVEFDLDLENVPVWFITGSQEHSPDGSYNSAFAFPPGWRGMQTYRKRHLLPFYESDFSRGTSSAPLWLIGSDTRLGSLICVEDTLPSLARDNAAAGANILLNLTDDSLFADPVVERQHFQNALFRAPETGLPLIRCAHTGVTAFIDRQGRVLQQLEPGHPGILTGKIAFRAHPAPTFFQQWGTLFPIGWAAWVLGRWLTGGRCARRVHPGR
ncbi:MAG: nitrilase-related carbon-nitrogen hydrolase [Chthoniobacterales bacterium]